MNDKDRIWYLVSKRLTNEADADELRELEDLLRSHPDMHYALQNITDLWNLPAKDDAEAEDAFDRHIAHMHASGVEWNNAEELPVTKPSRKRFLLPAVIMIILVASGIYIFYPTQKAVVAGKSFASTHSEISTNNGSRTKISLPDGTQVSLNADSKISWENPFNGALREVHLTGEAYFDVAHDKKRPFIVHTSGIDIKVLGTVFTVKSYPSDNTIETTLLKGSIEVLKRDDPDSSRVILRPSQKLVFNKQKQTEVVRPSGADQQPSPARIIERAILVTDIPSNKPDSMRKETSWVYNKLVFDGDRFDELAEKIERWYNVHINFKNERVRQYRFAGAFKNESIEQVLDALKLTARFEYRIDGNEIEIE